VGLAGWAGGSIADGRAAGEPPAPSGPWLRGAAEAAAGAAGAAARQPAGAAARGAADLGGAGPAAVSGGAAGEGVEAPAAERTSTTSRKQSRCPMMFVAT
ncbi:unnamed protein product, partial [Prorocentrum cordatum]